MLVRFLPVLPGEVMITAVQPANPRIEVVQSFNTLFLVGAGYQLRCAEGQIKEAVSTIGVY